MTAVASKQPSKTRVPPHLFEADPELGAEPWVPLADRGRRPRELCRFCGLAGEPGDARHPNGALPPPPVDPAELAAWREHDQAVLGERDDDQEGDQRGG